MHWRCGLNGVQLYWRSVLQSTAVKLHPQALRVPEGGVSQSPIPNPISQSPIPAARLFTHCRSVECNIQPTANDSTGINPHVVGSVRDLSGWTWRNVTSPIDATWTTHTNLSTDQLSNGLMLHHHSILYHVAQFTHSFSHSCTVLQLPKRNKTYTTTAWDEEAQ